MTSCHRAPPFPLSAANPLMEEAKAALAQPLLSPEALDSLYSTMASLRREIHANPEPGFEETKTNALLRSMLTTLAGIPESAFSDCAGTGLVVDMMGEGDFLAPAGASVRTIALRADMDALRMTEGNNGLPYRSANEGVAHLCGHDGHMASLVGAAALLRRRLSRVPRDCKVRLLFQPAEEGPGGAAPMVKGGCMQGVDEVYGYHNWPSWPLGHLKVAPGPVMAHPSSFEIVITGKGGHGSQPQFAVDPVLVSAHVIVALQSVVSRSVPSSEQAVLSVTMVHGGEVSNVIPDEVTLGGTIRDLKTSVFDTVCARMRTIVEGTCAAFGATATVKIDSAYPCVDNHAEQAQAVAECAARWLGADQVSSSGLPIMGGEDFSYFLHERPGCLFFLGGHEAALQGWSKGGDPGGARSNCMCHNTAFDFNDNLLPIAAVFWVRLVEARLGLELYTEGELPMSLPPPDAAGGAAAMAGEAAAAGEPGQIPAPQAPAAGPIVLPAKKQRT